MFGGLLVVTLIAFGGTWYAMHERIGDLQADKTDLQSQVGALTKNNAQCETNGQQLMVGISGLNESIDKLAAASQAAGDKAAKDMAGAIAQAKSITENSIRALAQPRTTQPGTLESCQAGARYLRGVP